MRYLYYLILLLALYSCQEEYTPKPYGYFRIDLPEKSYSPIDGPYPYRFDLDSKAIVETDKSPNAEPYWINISYPDYRAKIHLSYKEITTDSSLTLFQQDCHKMAYTHTIKAESINEQYFHKEQHTFGLIYFIEGNTASSTQFFITDSVKHFLRGALYFNEHPERDSLAPIINYIRQDIVTLMETIRFAKNNQLKSGTPFAE